MQKPGYRIKNQTCWLLDFVFRSLPIRFALVLLLFVLLLSSCESELVRRQEEQIRTMQEQITQQQQEIDELKLARLKAEQKRQDCNRAFRDFEKAQQTGEHDEAIALYRQGLRLCPDDDVARYELGKLLARAGRSAEAREEFEAALRINPDFSAARRELDALQARR